MTSKQISEGGRGSAGRWLAGLGLALGLALSTATGPVDAQQPAKKPAAGTQQPAKEQAKPAGEQSAWVKLCEKVGFVGKDKDGKEKKAEKSICLTHHERLDGSTGMVLISAALRQIEGADKQHMMVMVPLGMAIPPGLHTKVVSADLWAKAAKNEKIDDSKIAGSKMQFTLCHPAGCTAELEMTGELLGQMKGGGGLLIYAVNAAGQVIVFPVPLTGFKAALEGPAVDNKQYSEARKALMGQIRQRQIEAMEAYKKEQEKAGGAFKGAPGAPAAPPKK